MHGNDPATWAAFFTAVTGAAAALVGLLFVAVSINLDKILKNAMLPARAAETLAVLRSGPAVVWHPVDLLLGHAGGRPGTLTGGIAAQRVRTAAVTRMYQLGWPAPLPGVRVDGGVVKVGSGRAPVTCGE
jgi:hypothetical protein